MRGTKALWESDWMGWEVRPLVANLDDLQEALDRNAVQYIAMDDYRRWNRTVDPLLWQALREKGRFRQAFYIPLWEHGGWLSLYENLSPERRAQAEVRLDLRRSLGRVLERRIAIEGGGPVGDGRLLPIPFAETLRFWRGRWVFESHGQAASLERDSDVPQGGASRGRRSS